MARMDLLHQLMFKSRDPNEFSFEKIQGPPICSLLSPYDVQLLDDISRDPKLITKFDQRLQMNDEIMKSRGFMRLTQGTNRAVYKHLEAQHFVFKIAISDPGRKDSPAEMINQHKLKPFVAKCFDVSPTGIVGSFERVEDITSKEQFLNIADDVFTLLYDHIIGKYVMADIGTNFFRNYGIRIGFGPVLLDYPMLYEVDGAKLFCNGIGPFGLPCGGAIDYDEGANFLYCEKCGKQYTAAHLRKAIDENQIEIITPIRRKRKMKIEVFEGDKKVFENNLNVQSSDTYVRNKRNEKFKERISHQKELHVKEDDVEKASSVMDSKEVEEETEDEAINSTSNTSVYPNGSESDNQQPDTDFESEIGDDVDEEVVEEEADGSDVESDDEYESGNTDSIQGADEVGMDASKQVESVDSEEDDAEVDDEEQEYKNSLTPEDFLQDLENIRDLCNKIESDYRRKHDDINAFEQHYHILSYIVENLSMKYNIIKDMVINQPKLETETIVAPKGDIQSPEELKDKMSNY